MPSLSDASSRFPAASVNPERPTGSRVEIVPTEIDYRPAYLVICPSGDRWVRDTPEEAKAQADICESCPGRAERPAPLRFVTNPLIRRR